MLQETVAYAPIGYAADAEVGVPLTLLHGDLHGLNILGSAARSSTIKPATTAGGGIEDSEAFALLDFQNVEVGGTWFRHFCVSSCF
jgi:hypothetical protein